MNKLFLVIISLAAGYAQVNAVSNQELVTYAASTAATIGAAGALRGALNIAAAVESDEEGMLHFDRTSFKSWLKPFIGIKSSSWLKPEAPKRLKENTSVLNNVLGSVGLMGSYFVSLILRSNNDAIKDLPLWLQNKWILGGVVTGIASVSTLAAITHATGSERTGRIDAIVVLPTIALIEAGRYIVSYIS